MSGIQFAQPEWATALWAVAAVAGVLIFLELRGGRNLNRFIKTNMQGRLVHRLTPGRRFSSLALLIVSLVAIVIALMRPQWGIEFIRTPQVGAEIMIALDVSRSMLAEDVAPNRLERAKAEIRDLLPYLEGDQVGLIAFAGRASVLSPLTPDFGFLRLVLDHVRAGSVARGGTRLEEPIRKATEGFGSTGDLARVLLFFTDGEDHDSFPLDAAKEAAERGIRIVIIGFGDETGSEIWVTDPLSGARTRIVDADGRPAISRLDGTLLRELALVTEGAYVPAGTGVLDLKSIFDAHLRPLMRGEGESAGHTVQKEGFGWALLVALLALIGHGLLTQQRQRPASALLLILLILPGVDAHAQNDPTQPPPALESLEASEKFPDESTTAALDVPEDPRQAYNQGVDAFDQGELNDAERLFEAARQEARGDGTLRFQATYNQSWVEVERAEEKLQEDPASALENLERAADWLREAIALRPENKSARINLEILLQRMLLLSDALASENPPDIARRLDTLIESQRAVTREIRNVAGQFEKSPDLDADEPTRARFRGVAVSERTVLTDTGQLAKTVGDELSSLQKKPEAERTPEEAMQIASLEGVLHYLHRSRERIGQSRVQLRRRQAGRAHRRAVAGLFELKRAREQLLGPVELIDGLIQDNHELTEETALLLSGTVEFASPSDTSSFASPQIPTWLDLGYLEEAARSLTERTSELNTKLSAGLGQSQGSTDPAQQKAMETLRATQPHIEVAAGKLADAADGLASAEPERALKDEFASLEALIQAREQLLDLRGLIEIAWSDESRIRAVLENEESASLVELAQALAELQGKNLERAERMGLLIEEERSALSSSASGSETANEEDRAAEEERLELANGILALIESAMRGAHDSLNSLGQEPTALDKANERVAQSIRGLEGLRRLFFSIIEHLKDVAQLQAQLGDETEEVAAKTVTTELLGPLEKHQQELAERSEELAQVLHEQSFAQPEELVGQEASQDPAAAEEAAERLTQASELVLMASQDMLAAADGLESPDSTPNQNAPSATSPETDLEEVRGQQDAALDKLAEALAILEPPQPESEPENQEQQDQQDQESQGQGDQTQEQQTPKESETPQDPNQLLQSVRDREAERHRRRQEEDPSGYNPVEKDW